MALFEKRTWLARIGTGLNKFIIGARDGNNKQTLENSPDSVTQQGDVISADNLNDLEDRIEAGINKVYGTLGWGLAWTNPSPTSDFAGQTIDLNGYGEVMIIAYYIDKTDPSHDMTSLHMAIFKKNGSRFDGLFNDTWISANGVEGACRGFYQGSNEGQLIFEDAKSYIDGVYDDTHSNDLMIPVAVYMSDIAEE